METLKYWNHNTAYYKWIKQQVSTRSFILDIGCGDGSLIRFLEDGSKKRFVGIDRNESCITKAKKQSLSSSSQFIGCDFENYTPEISFDAILFVASLHHMDMSAAIKKAKSLLSANGILLIVGLAKPSTAKDHVIEALRILPCKIISKCKHMHPCEDLQIPVSYHLPLFNEVRNLASTELPHCTIRQGLYYRYLIAWVKQ